MKKLLLILIGGALLAGCKPNNAPENPDPKEEKTYYVTTHFITTTDVLTYHDLDIVCSDGVTELSQTHFTLADAKKLDPTLFSSVIKIVGLSETPWNEKTVVVSHIDTIKLEKDQNEKTLTAKATTTRNKQPLQLKEGDVYYDLSTILFERNGALVYSGSSIVKSDSEVDGEFIDAFNSGVFGGTCTRSLVISRDN